MKRALHIGPLIFRDPVLLCGALYVLLWFDASGFLRLGLCAAFLHEWGHILVYWAMFRTFPTIEVTLTGFCMRTRGRSMTPQQTFWLAAAGPLANLLACAAVLLFMRGAGYSYGGYWFACCNLLVGGSNLLPLPGLDGWHIAGALHGIWRT